MLANERDGLAIVVGGLLVVAASLIDHAQAVIAVVDIGEAHQKIASALFGFVELTGMDEVDNSIGSRGELILILVVVEVRIDHGFRSDRPRRFCSSSGSQGLVL